MKRRPARKNGGKKPSNVSRAVKSAKKRQPSVAEVEKSLLAKAKKRILSAQKRAKSKKSATRKGSSLEVKPRKLHSQPPAVVFDPYFVPIDRTARRIRHELLSIGVLRLPGGRFFRPADTDSFVAAELHRLEEAGAAALEGLVAALGQGANWRDALIFEASRDAEAYKELCHRRAKADAQALSWERREFDEAAARVNRFCRRRGPEQRSKLWAILFGLHHLRDHGRLPTRKATKDYLASEGLYFPAGKDGNNDRRFFSGPFLSKFPVGRPWHGHDPAISGLKLRGRGVV
jgi:hypothetical protein